MKEERKGIDRKTKEKVKMTPPITSGAPVQQAQASMHSLKPPEALSD